MRRLSAVLGAVVLLGSVAAACGSADPAGSPPAEAGSWMIWSPDRQVDDTPSEDTGNFVKLAHSFAWDEATFGGDPLEPEFVALLRPSLWMRLDLEEGGSNPSMADVRVECGPVVLNETVEFDPPKTVAADGTVAVDLGFLQWEGTFSGSESFSGEWTAGDCGGSWDATGDNDDDFGVFFSQEDMAEARDARDTE